MPGPAKPTTISTQFTTILHAKVASTKGIILHGGKGTRLRPLTQTGPKQLIPVANKPISQYALEDLKSAGIYDIAIVLGDVFPEKVRAHFGDGSRFGVKVTYVEQGKPLGIAHALGLCESFIGEDKFVLYLGDNLVGGGISGFVSDFSSESADFGVALAKVKDPRMYGVARFKNGRLVDLVEKPASFVGNDVVTGVYLFTKRVFPYIRKLKPSARGELEITNLLQSMLDDPGLHHKIYRVSDWWDDTGTVEDILTANMFVLDRGARYSIQGRIEDGCNTHGRISLGRDSLVKKGTTMRGPIVIGDSCEIGPDVYIGPYTSVGNKCKIVNSRIENSILMDEVIMKNSGTVTDSLVGEKAEILGASGPLSGHRFVLGESSRVVLDSR